MLRVVLVASLLAQSIPHRRPEIFNIAVVLAQKSADVERSLRMVERKITLEKVLPSGTTLRTRPYVFKHFSTSFYSSLVSVCNVIKTGNISMVIIVHDMGENSWIIPWVSSVLRIPVSLAYKSSRIAEHTVVNNPTMLNMIPAVAEACETVGGILRYFGWRNLAILTGIGEEGAQATGRILESMKLNNRKGTRVLLHKQFNSNDLGDTEAILRSIGDLDVTAIFLHCEPSDVEFIFSAAKKSGLLASGDRVWIVTEAVIEGCSAGASSCPSGLIGLRLRRSCEPGVEKESNFVQDLVHDSVMVYARALADHLREENVLGIPPSSCEGRPLQGGEQLFKYALNTSIQAKTGLIKFDSKGHRVEPEYEIVNLRTSVNGTTDWAPVAFWVQGVVDCNGNKFEWPSGTEFPPLDMTQKRVLRVVTSLTEPFSFYSGTKFVDKNGKDGKIVCATGHPCKKYSYDDNRTETTSFHCCTGLVIDLLKMLEIDIGFQSELHIVKDGKYGAKDDKTGEWNGMIGEILRGEADLALADLTITDSRHGVVEFTHPFFPVGMSIMVSVKKTKNDWLVRFLEPFSTEMWVTTVVTVNIVFISLWMLDRVSPLGHYRRGTSSNVTKKFDIVASLWFTWGTIFHIDESEARPKSFSARVVTVCFAFAMTILTTSYTANLAAVLVSESEDLPVSPHGIQDPKFQNPSLDFKFATVSHTSMEKVFKESKDPMYIRIWKNMKERNVDTFDAGVEKVLSGELDAFIGDMPTLLYAASKQEDCQLRMVGKTFFQSGFGLAFPKNSTWTKIFSRVLLLYEQLDIPQKLSEVWLSGTCGKQEPLTVSTFVEMTIEDVSGALTIVSIGIGLALILLFVEFKVAKHGFPLSRLWTNDPNWKVEKTLTPTSASVHHSVTPVSTQALELSFSQRRTADPFREETDVYFQTNGSSGRFEDTRLPERFGERNQSFDDFDLNLEIQDLDSGRGSIEDHPQNVRY